MKKTKQREKSSLTEKLIAVWLKHDPFVRLVAKDDYQIRHQAMLAMVGEAAAKRSFARLKKYKPPPPLIYPGNVRQREQEFLQEPKKRSRIIHQLVHWGRNKYLNRENPDSHNTRVQIVHSLLGPLFLNSDEKQEQLIIDGIKVLIVSRQTSQGKLGEKSPLVHREILQKASELLNYNQLVISGKQNQSAQIAMRAQLIKTIQGFRKSTHRSAYYVADDQKNRRKLIAQKFPLKTKTHEGLLVIVKHYTYSAWPEFRRLAQATLAQLT